MYDLTLVLHNALRWVLIGAGLYAVARAFAGMAGKSAWTSADNSAGKWFTMAVDIQLVIGLLLYGVLSPITKSAFSDFGAAMGDRVLRFWAVEHSTGMLIGLIVIHVARARSKRAQTDSRKHRIAAIGFSIGLLIILASVPWPFMADGRELINLP